MSENENFEIGSYYKVKALDHNLRIKSEGETTNLYIEFVGKFLKSDNHYHHFILVDFINSDEIDLFSIIKNTIIENKIILELEE